MTRQGGGQRRRSRGRRALLGLVVLALALTACALLGPSLVPADRLGARVAEALGAAAGGRATVGAARLTLVGGPGLKLRDVQLDAGAAGAVTCTDASVSLAVLPLLRRALVVDALSARGPAARATWQGRPVELGDFALRADRLRLVLPPLDGGAVATSADPATGWLTELTGAFALTAARADWAPLALTGLDCEGRVDGRRVTVRRLETGLGGGRVTVAGTLDLGAGAAGSAEAELTLETVAVDALLGRWAPDVAARLAANLSGAVKVACPLGPAEAVVPGLRADGLLTAGEGLLRAGDWLEGAGPYLGDRPDLVDIRFTSGALGFRLADGACAVDSLRLSGPDTAWDLRGNVGLGGTRDSRAPAPGTLDLAVHLRLPAGYTPRLGSLAVFAEALRDRDRRVNLDLKVAGPIDAAAVTLDLGAMSKRAARAGT